MTETTATTAEVAAEATIPDYLPLSAITLIGIAGSPGQMRALLRLTSGRIQSVATGDHSRAGTVIEITEAGVLFERDGTPTLLAAPEVS